MNINLQARSIFKMDTLGLAERSVIGRAADSPLKGNLLNGKEEYREETCGDMDQNKSERRQE